ncbi:hypothetical protein MNBD_IGNAVI01-216 [hydrothermal vent metagenome]|uniref:Phosphate-selective porin O and P n=1 Tax=hydrothermal vent metagenome TaxID=652676 RepID=A0A3B1CBF9_9ZZZZ
MNKFLKIYFLLMVVFFISGTLFAQNEEDFDKEDPVEDLAKEVNTLKPGSSRFLMRGYAHAGIEFLKDNTTFVGGSFNPIFLWQQSKRLLFESELELELTQDGTELGLEYADMAYFINQYLTVRMGKFLLPFGTFGEKLHPRWINRLPSNPLGFTHEGQVGPMSDLGVEIRGAAYMTRNAWINYSLYVVNGPKLNDGTDEPEEGGQLHYNNYIDNNKAKSFGGRIGILPLYNSSLEIGLSGQFGKVGTSKTAYENIGSQLYAIDLSYVTRLDFMKSMLDIKGQWNRVSVDQASYPDPENADQSYTFENVSNAYYGQVSIKTAFVDNDFFNKLEFVGRYSKLELPSKAVWGGEDTQITVGINYWLDWRTVVKFAYQTLDSSGEADGHSSVTQGDAFLMHWSIGF